MELKGFYYDNRLEKIEVWGEPLPKSYKDKGYTEKKNAEGVVRWWVPPIYVWLCVEHNGKQLKFDIYQNIMAIHPERERISLRLVQDDIARIIKGEIELKLIDGKLFLAVKPKKTKARSRKTGN